MNIIIPDIDKYIVDLADLQLLSNLLCVNKFFRDIISVKPIMIQRKYMIDKNILSVKCIFTEACRNGFLEYAVYLVDKYNVDIHMDNENAFRICCEYGHIEFAKWLVLLGELVGHTKININIFNNIVFINSCANGYIDIARWLVLLGETDSYNKINNCHANNHAFNLCCYYGHIEIARWLIKLGESDGYDKIDVRAHNNFAKKYCCANGHKGGYNELVQWLDELMVSDTYL